MPSKEPLNLAIATVPPAPQPNPLAALTRRRWLQGGGALAGAMLWPQLLRAKETPKARSSPARACIVIYLQGGLSHYESFDPKPDAPSAYRSTFGDIPTTLPGIHFAEHLPLLAKRAHKFSLIRSAGLHKLIGLFQTTPLLAGNPNRL